MNIASLLLGAAKSHSRQTAVSWIDQSVWTYQELMDRASTLAAGMRSLGLEPGDRITIAMANSPAFYEVLLASWIAGLVPAPQNCRLHPLEISYATRDCEARACFATSDLAAALTIHLPQTCPVFDVDSADFAGLHAYGRLDVEPRPATDPAFLFYTSGTTGKSKGAVLSHRSLTAMMIGFIADSGMVADDHVLHLAPLSHASGFIGLSYLLRGRNNVVLPTTSMDVLQIRRALLAFGPLSFFAVPTIVQRLSRAGMLETEHVERVGRIYFGGAPMYVEDLKQALKIFGPDRLWHLYGQGESPNTISYLPPRLMLRPQDAGFDERLSSVGIPRSGVLVRIAREDGSDAEVGEVGEVVVSGDVVMTGYWNQPAATAGALRNGWLYTGDLGRMDAQGFLYLIDRSKDMLISGGSNVYPREIEEVLLAHPGVVACAVIGVPHAEWGEVAEAFVVSQGSVSTAELDALCLAHLARYKKPTRYHFVDDLPKSGYGKVLKSELRRMAGMASRAGA